MKLKSLVLILSLATFTMLGLSYCNSIQEEVEEVTLSNIMRERVDELRKIRESILKDETPVLSGFTLFKDGVPSRENLLSEEQWEELHSFDFMYDVLTKQATAASYNAIIQTCLTCHERTCPGPVRLIKGLKITDEELASKPDL